MSEQERRLWPFKPRTSIAAAVLILFGLLLTLVILRITSDWPSSESETVVLLGIFLLSLLPISLVLVDTLIERGGVLEYRNMKIDKLVLLDPVGASWATIGADYRGWRTKRLRGI